MNPDTGFKWTIYSAGNKKDESDRRILREPVAPVESVAVVVIAGASLVPILLPCPVDVISKSSE